MEKFKVTPWEVKGEVDYTKLIEEFGTQEINNELLARIKKHTKELHVFLKRKYFFSHRDLNIVLDEYEAGNKFYLYTGRGPSGKMHLGHLVPLLFTSWLQKKFNVNCYIQMTDDEKFLFNRELNLTDTNSYADDNILDIIPYFNPDKTFIFKDIEYINKLYPMALKVAKKVNFSTAKAVFGFTNQSSIGQILWPAIQAVPAFFERNICLIPSAIDQDNYWRITRDIANSLGYKKNAAIHSKFLPALTGPQGKMSASEAETCIWLNDNPEAIKRKIMKYAFSGGQATMEEHRKKGGNPDVDVSYQWLAILFEENDAKLKKIHDNYKSGKLTTGELKGILIDKINLFLKQHQKERKKAEALVKKFKYTGKLAKEMWE